MCVFGSREFFWFHGIEKYINIDILVFETRNCDVIADGTSGSGFSRFTICGKIQYLRGLRALIPVRVSLFQGFERFVMNLCVAQGLFRSLTSYLFDQRQLAN